MRNENTPQIKASENYDPFKDPYLARLNANAAEIVNRHFLSIPEVSSPKKDQKKPRDFGVSGVANK